ncbi:MAG: excisionase family DNA-binding protein [Candidatus Omnitrophota bacterium]
MKPMISNEDKFLTTTQAAGLLSVSVSTLKKFVGTGRIRAIKTPGGHYRIRKKDLMENLYA